jgi:diguanylate cyclase (GGDEF)-like protein
MQQTDIRALIANRGLWLIFLAALAGLYAIYAVDVFQDEAAMLEDRRLRIEFDEFLLFASALMLALFGFGLNQHRARVREWGLRVQAERDVRDLGYHDALTGLPNRRAFDEALARLAEGPGHATHAVLMLDLNGFKEINDVHGHGAGDAMLRAVAGRIAGAVRDGDCAARLGGDEFAVIAPMLASPQSAVAIAGRIAASITRPVMIDGSAHRVGTGIGIALARGGDVHPAELVRRADVALYAAKRERGEAWRVYAPELEA